MKNYSKLVLLMGIIFLSMSSVIAQKGLYFKFSLGPGCTTEFANLKTSAFSIATKNHAIGWGITDDFAVQIGDFGFLTK